MTAPLEFSLRWIEATGGLAEETSPGVFGVLPAVLPEGVSRLEALTGEPEIAREDPSVELVAPGSVVLDALLREAKGAGRAARSYLVGLTTSLPTDGLRAFRVLGGTSRIEAVRAFEHRTVAFTFHVAYESDERADDVVTIGVDLASGRIARRSLDAALSSSSSSERLEAWPLAPAIALEEGYATARAELPRRLASSISARQAELDRLLAQERQRTAKYHDDLARELRDERGTAAPEEVAAKIAATGRQRDRMLQELGDKYALRVSASLATLLVLIHPKLHVEVSATPRAGGSATTLHVVWDPLTGAPEALDCPSCGRPGFEFSLASERLATTLRCAGCAGPISSPAPVRRKG